jgi:hypothetical protein
MKKLFLFSFTIASLSSCKKDSENTPSKADLLTNKSWRLTAFTTISTTAVTGSSPSTSTSDEYAKLQACEKDDFLKFNTDKILIDDEGPSKCNTADSQRITSQWDFNSDQTKLLVTSTGSLSSTETGDIIELSVSTLRLRKTFYYGIGPATLTLEATTTYTSF